MPPSAAVAAPLGLAEGDTPAVTIEVPASQVWRHSYLLEGRERISWEVEVQGSLDVAFCARVVCRGAGGRSRELAEKSRGEKFAGFLDLGNEHSEWLEGLGVAGADAAGEGASAGAVLEFELDNFYSYFTAKRVKLRLHKTPGASPPPPPPVSIEEVLGPSEPHPRVEHAMKLLSRMRQLGIQPDLKTFNAALTVCRDALRWEDALQLLDDMRVGGVEPDAESLEIARTACERCGQADRAAELRQDQALSGLCSKDGEEPAPAPGPASTGAADGADDVAFVRSALIEALGRCPPEAREVLGHLLAAQESLDRFARGPEPEPAPAPAPVEPAEEEQGPAPADEEQGPTPAEEEGEAVEPAPVHSPAPTTELDALA